jgi:transposase
MEIQESTLGGTEPGGEMLGTSDVETLFALHRVGWSVKGIAREMGWSRNTVRAWLRRGPSLDRPTAGRPRALGRFEEWLRKRFLGGVRNADVLRQELAERGVLVSLRTVERFVAPLRAEALSEDRATLRFETPPGRQMQIDFGEKWIEVLDERVKAFVFVATLGFSRKTFARVYPAQRQRHWLEGLEAALRHFGGAPEECVVDNAKALVLRWENDRPVFHPEFEAFCRHWGMKPRACRPYRPRTKGKVERGVGYVKGNALGRLRWESWEALDAHLMWWMREVADVRTHGTTGERPVDRFEQEALALHPIGVHPSHLRARRFTRKATGDCRIEFETNRYSVPFQLVGRTVDVAVEGGELTVRYGGEVVAEHRLATGRHRDIEDPGHVEGLVRKTYRQPTPCELQRPLSVYEAVAGGERW